MRFTTIIFDFDGTIAESLDEGIVIYNDIAAREGYLAVSRENLELLRSKNVREVLKELHIPLLRVPGIVREFRARMEERIPKLRAVPGVAHAVQGFHDRGVVAGILTSNSEKNVNEFLQRNTMEFFDFCSAGIGIFGKENALRRLLRESKLEPRSAVYVGDEICDIEAGHRAGIAVAAVTWGANSETALAAARGRAGGAVC